jgi:pteridine reductase
MLTRCLAKELAPEVRVNAIAPGTITMPGDPPQWEADFGRLAPLHRSGRPDDIVTAVSYLADAKFVTGQVLVVDGGRTL